MYLAINSSVKYVCEKSPIIVNDRESYTFKYRSIAYKLLFDKQAALTCGFAVINIQSCSLKGNATLVII